MSKSSPTSKEAIILEARQRCLTDEMYLQAVLGYEFQDDVHTSLFSHFPRCDGGKTPLLLLSDTKDVLTLWFRGGFKSTAATVKCIQLILNYPDIRIAIMRSTQDSTAEWLSEIVAHFTGEASGSRLKALFPEFCGSKKELTATANRFIVPNRKQKQLREATVTVVSTKTNVAGKHFDAGFFDDLVTEQNYQNPKVLEGINKTFSMLIPLINPGGYKFVTGTRYAAGDLYEKMQADGGWSVSTQTCWKEDNTPYFPQRNITKPEGSVKIIGHTVEYLNNIARTNPTMFASQYLMRPAIEGIAFYTEEMLNQARILNVTVEDVSKNLTTPMLFIDYALSNSERSDDCVILATKLDPRGNIYVIDGVGGQWSPEDFCLQIINMTLKHRPAKVMVEKTPTFAALAAVLRLTTTQRHVQVPLDYIKVDKQPDAKAIRIRGVAAFLSAGRLKFFPGLSIWKKMVEQFCNFTGKTWQHDDYPDTVALACNFLSGSVTPFARTSQNDFINDFERNEQEIYQQSLVEMGRQQLQSYEGGMGSDFAC